MAYKTLALSHHLYFVREGDTIDGTTVSSTAKPDNDPAENWPKMGIVKQPRVSNNSTEIEDWEGQPGRLGLVDVHLVKQDITVRWTFDQLNELALEIIWGAAGAIDLGAPGNGVFGVNRQTAPVKGWAKMQSYDQANNLIQTVDLWGRLKIDEIDLGMGEDRVSYEAEMRLLGAVSEGTLSNLS